MATTSSFDRADVDDLADAIRHNFKKLFPEPIDQAKFLFRAGFIPSSLLTAREALRLCLCDATCGNGGAQTFGKLADAAKRSLTAEQVRTINRIDGLCKYADGPHAATIRLNRVQQRIADAEMLINALRPQRPLARFAK